jgi:hypothetical protein
MIVFICLIGHSSHLFLSPLFSAQVDDVHDQLTAGDDGGPSRAFLSEVWRQIRDLKVQHNEREANLFTEDYNCLPSENNNIAMKLQLSNDPEMARLLVHPYYRALGRILLYTIGISKRKKFYDGGDDKEKKIELFIAPHVLPGIYRYYFLKNMDPMNQQYPLADLLHHVIEMKFSKSTLRDQSNEAIMELYATYADTDGDIGSDVHSNFRRAAKKDFIDNRSWALDAIKEGITLDGKLN